MEGQLGVGCGSSPPPLCRRWWALTFFGHKVDEAAPHLHLGRLDLTLAGGCPSANTQEVMSPALGAGPEHVPLTSPSRCSQAGGRGSVLSGLGRCAQ